MPVIGVATPVRHPLCAARRKLVASREFLLWLRATSRAASSAEAYAVDADIDAGDADAGGNGVECDDAPRMMAEDDKGGV